MPEPRHNRGNSEQEVATPGELIRAVTRRFGPISWDLAANEWNSWGELGYYSKKQDSLAQDWTLHNGLLWLNPEFGFIKPWAKKCFVSTLKPGRSILMLTPLTTAGWACDWTWDKAYVIGLKGRVRFVGHSIGYTKDLMLSVYGMGITGFEIWDWREVAGC